jgi:hypothetical protein
MQPISEVGPNLERDVTDVKQKRPASADFLGFTAFP